MVEENTLIEIDMLNDITTYISDLIYKNKIYKNKPRKLYSVQYEEIKNYNFELYKENLLNTYKYVITTKKYIHPRGCYTLKYVIPKQFWLELLETLSDEVYNNKYLSDETKDKIYLYICNYKK